jgi:4-hydroxy-3-polyprenylbenzoate decarboxylase
MKNAFGRHAYVSYFRKLHAHEGQKDSLDHASRMPNYGSKMGVDATTKWPSEGHSRRWPHVIKMSSEVVQRVDELWKRAGLDRK